MPIAAFADYATADEIVAVFDAARARWQKDPSRDVFVVVGFHQETAHEFGGRLGEALKKVRARPELAGGLVFTTIEDAAERARHGVSPAPL
jgi:broad specificity phosphatase PhoE